jgi:nucleoside-diphosphate-sugar epimerase
MIPGRPYEPTLTPYGLRQATGSLTLDISGAKAALDWQPVKTFEEGMEELE